VIQLLKDKRCYAANSTGFENVVLYNTYGYFMEEMVDTRLMASYVNENDFMGLKHLSKRDLGYTQTSYAEVIGDRSGMREITGKEVFDYGIDDVITCDALQNLYTTIMLYESTYNAFMEIEKDSAFVTSLAFASGVAFDREAYTKLKTENDANILRAEKELEDMLIALEFGEDVVYRPLPGLLIKSSIAKLFEAVTGEKFNTPVRTVKSCIEWLRVEGHEVIADTVAAGIEAVNEMYLKHWRPRANLNVRSPTQVKELIYTKLQCPVRIRNKVTDTQRKKGMKEGNPSTDDEAIANAIAFGDVTNIGKEVLEKLLEYKGYLTRESLFLSKYPRYVHWKTGRIHGSVTQCGTTTRRFTHSAPNWGQMPKRKGKEVRDVIKADEGQTLVSLDYGSQELRLQAEDCGCKEFVACYIGDKLRDMHTATGYHVAMIQGAEVGTYEEFEALVKSGDVEAKKFRADGKAVNFASSYGASARRLSAMMAIPDSTAALFLEAKAKAFPGLIPYVTKFHNLCAKRRYSLSFMGVRRHLAKQYGMANSDSARSAVDRLAWSYRIQGSASEMVKLTMGRLYRSGILKDCVLCWGQIHDEVNFQVPTDRLNELVPILAEYVCMPYADMKIPLVTDPAIGKNFGSLKEFKLEDSE